MTLKTFKRVLLALIPMWLIVTSASGIVPWSLEGLAGLGIVAGMLCLQKPGD